MIRGIFLYHLARVARKLGMLSISAYLIHKATLLSPYSVPVFREACIQGIASRQFDSVVQRCAAIGEMPKASDHLKDLATTYLARANIEDNGVRADFDKLQNACRSVSRLIEGYIEQGNVSEAREAFKTALEYAGTPHVAVPSWIEAFDLTLAEAPWNKRPDAANNPVQPDFDIPKIVVSGMYWSGSGALYAFFREFEQVNAIPGELRLWKEGDFCLNALAMRLVQGSDFHSGCRRFLVTALTGIGPVYSWQEEMAVAQGLQNLRNDVDGSYAGLCLQFFNIICKRPVALHLNDFRLAAGTFSAGLAILLGRKSTGYPLFDNIIHIGGIEAAHLLGKVRVFCTFRDPRSNFVARWYENPRFHRDVHRYIEYYRNTRIGFEKALAEDVELASKVSKVGFEQFILSKEYRESLALDCGLDLSRQKAGSHFNPGLSFRNVYNYHSFPGKTELSLIEHELGEYCIDPGIISGGTYG